jgi:glycoprotein endo-alpha-1,2-mannosidase
LILALTALLGLAGSGSGGSATSRPRAAIFYYPWYGTAARDGGWQHWNQLGHRPPLDVASNFYPARGAYSSDDVRVVRAQMTQIARTGVGEVVVSWWGRSSTENARLPLVLREARRVGLEVAAHLEPYGGRSIDTVRADLAYLRRLGIRDVFVYDPFSVPDADWATLLPTLKGLRLFAQTAFVARAAAARFTGVYTYDVVDFSHFTHLCGMARNLGLLCAPSVGPGFDARRATGGTLVRSRRNGATYDALWSAALHAHPDLVTITSYNEWHEGTQIEPARTKPPAGFGYQSYDGAWGLHGRAAARAYLDRTSHWVRRLRGG